VPPPYWLSTFCAANVISSMGALPEPACLTLEIRTSVSHIVRDFTGLVLEVFSAPFASA
jgi:hypothetical protein